MRFFANAKVNLSLSVVGRRADGYHLLQSVMAPIDLGDVLHVEPDDVYTLSVEGPYAAHAPATDANLITRVVRVMEAKARRRAGMRIRLQKNIPAGSGLGGGSGDAAAAMHALNALWGGPFSVDDLCALGLGIGAEMPFMLRGQAAYVEGIGDVQSAVELPAYPAVLIWPGVTLPTADVFKAYAQSGLPFTPSQNYASILMDRASNDLEAVSARLCPEIAVALGVLRAEAGVKFARMSGSGSSVFAVFSDIDAAMGAAQKISGANPKWWARACMINPRA